MTKRDSRRGGTTTYVSGRAGALAWCALALLSGCKSEAEKAVLAVVGDGACGARASALDTKDDEPLLAQLPSCPQAHPILEHEACKKLTADGACVAHARAAKDGADQVDYCLVRGAQGFKVDGACTAAAALVRAYYANEACEERAKVAFAPEENKAQLALVQSRQKSCRAEVKALDLAGCAGTLHAKDGRCVAKATLGDGKTAEVCVRRDGDRVSVDVRCTELLDGPDGRRVVVKPAKNYDERHPEKDFVSVEVVVSERDQPYPAWLDRRDDRPATQKLVALTAPAKVLARTARVELGGTASLVLAEVLSDGVWQGPVAPPCPSDMALVPGGTFKMGSDTGEPDERPAHGVGVAAFCLDLTEVTAAAYDACAARGACTTAPKTVDWPRIDAADREFYSKGCTTGRADRASHPINCVDWTQAKAYCEAHGRRLPTEEEWEYAAAGGDEQRLYPWGPTPPGPTLLNACGGECVAWAAANGKTWRSMYAAADGHETTAPVGSYPSGKGRWGHLDLAGNVSEWTSSAYSTSYASPRDDSYRVYRGGGWSFGGPSDVRSADRYGGGPSLRRDSLGFRCAGSPLP